ncbi:MAG TPA: shikimate kinase [Clostridiaceae bacterium]|nr:shikimate kinase [Clostridiaceae bacterium]
MKNSIVLIGMPGSGKSTVGKSLSERLKLKFTDTDILISSAYGKTPGDIVKEHGREFFLNMQEEIILGMDTANQVIATGGSVIMSEAVMKHLGNNGIIVFIKLGYDPMVRRLAPDRRLARGSGQSLMEMYDERLPLYEKYADIIVDCGNRCVTEITEEIIDKTKNNFNSHSSNAVQ